MIPSGASVPRGRLVRLQWMLAAVGAVSALVILLVARRLGTEPELSPAMNLPAGFAALPDFHLVDQQGKSFDRKDLLGKVWVAGFLFTRCHETCPMIAGIMARLQAELPPDVGLLSFTVDPRYDVPAVLNEYSRSFKADPDRWRFLTGSQEEVYRLLEAGFKLPARENPDPRHGEEKVTHTTRLAVLDSRARVRGYFDATDPASLSLLPRRLRSLAKESP